jgi:signal transduction histidine kinase
LRNQKSGAVEVESPYDGIRRIYGLARTSSSQSTVIVGIPSATLYEPARRHFLLYVSFSLLVFICALLAGLFIARGITRPIRELRAITQAFGADDLTARAPVTQSGEIGDLSTAFNQMAQQIAEREEKLKELDRLKSEFVSSVSHELRTPLTTIKTLTHVLLRNDRANWREHLETIAVECNRQIELVNNLLDLSRIQSGEYKINMTRVDPAEVLSNSQKIEQHAAAARGQTLRCEIPRDLASVKAEPTTLRRILCALIENAIKFTPDGGVIIVGARNDFKSVALCVHDTGQGISVRDLPYVFEKFYRGANGDSADAVQQPGVGLGLYIVHGLIEQLGGRIEVESVVGQGSTFTIYLPKWDEQNEEAEEVEHVEALAGS